jgi:hypothetical protein
MGADNSVLAVIRTLQHRPRLSNKCVGQTLTDDESETAAVGSGGPHGDETSGRLIHLDGMAVVDNLEKHVLVVESDN